MKNSFERPEAILMIDMQRPFLEDIQNAPELITRQLDVLSQFKHYNIPAIAIEYNNHGPTIPVLKDTLRRYEQSTSVQKPFDDGFLATRLDDLLQEREVKNVLLMGVNASACVRKTAIGGQRKYSFFTSAELIADPAHWEQDYHNWYEANTHYTHTSKELFCKKIRL